MGKEGQSNIITTIDNSNTSMQELTSSHSISQSINNIYSDLELNKIDSSDTSDSENETSIQNNLINNLTNINFNNFNQDLNLEEKYNYLKFKFYNKGIEDNIPFLDWFINLLNNTDGNKNSIDNTIESNLNKILKIQREAQLNNLAFFRNKPFLLNKFDDSPIAFPQKIPVFKQWSIYD